MLENERQVLFFVETNNERKLSKPMVCSIYNACMVWVIKNVLFRVELKVAI